MIGLKRNTVSLVKYNPEWIELFNKEKVLLKEILGQDAIGIEHIGSTAIIGIMAKPIIDIALGIDFKKVNEIKTILENNNWIFRPKFGDINKHVVFAKGNDIERTHYLHLMQYDSKEWNEKIFFRDYLNNHEKERIEYEELKIEAMNKFSDDRKNYTKEKGEFVQKIIDKASSTK
jgi:GrpB-like predicted nucleotidyltransferase (UPF0157 family)